MQTVWEARFLNSHFLLTIEVSVIVMLGCVYFFVKHYDAYAVLIRLICSVFFIATLSFCVSSLLSAHRDWRYAQENQLTVEGVVENLITSNNGSDSFSVNGVYFWCTPVDNNLFAYTLTKKDSGCAIHSNGQYVRLTYCAQNDLNCILKIETNTNEKQEDGSLVP